MHNINPLKTQLNPICHLLALLGTHPILHIGRIRVNIILVFSIQEITTKTYFINASFWL